MPDMGQHQQQLLVALGATTGACVACIVAHNLWQRRQRSLDVQKPFACLWTRGTLYCGSTPAACVDHQQIPSVVYDYAQSMEEVLVEARLPLHVQPHDIQVKFGPATLLVIVGKQRVIDGCLAGHILPQQSCWRIEGCGPNRKLSISLCKQPTSHGQQYAVWSSLLRQGDIQILADQRDQSFHPHES